ncbi:MAG: RIO1 family regulatory kinase/ATPase [archaeon]
MDIDKIEGYVFDDTTHKALFKLSSNNIIDAIDYPISSGKEAITFLGHLKDNLLVAKIFKNENTTKFKNMEDYINGDRRFERRTREKRIIDIWASKEYKNLSLAHKNLVSCPIPITVQNNVLIMSFLGEEKNAFPLLKEVKDFDFEKVYVQIIDNYGKLLYAANLVHADFSAYNILINPTTDEIYIIDFGQAVITSHPKASDFLKRDIINITDFLNKFDKTKKLSYESILEDIKKRKDIYGRNIKDK